jgi:hypothetical protein
MKTLGTVLPTQRDIDLTNSWAKRQAAERARIADVTPELKNCERRIVGGEVRYYDTADQYAIVSRQGKVLWFAVSADGDRRI